MAEADPPMLIVNADDFGLHTSINAAIFEGHEHGIITSTSLMPLEGVPSFDEAVMLAAHHPTLDIGLHFCLIGLPGLPAGYRGFLPAYLSGKFPTSRIESLLNRQLDLLASRGIAVSHIDSHQHLHALPRVMRVVCHVAAERGIMDVRLPREYSPQDAPTGRSLAAHALGRIAASGARSIAAHGLNSPDHFLGMAVSGHLTAEKLLRLIERIPPFGVTEILCHPGADNVALGDKFDWGYDWEGELAAVIDSRVKERLLARSIALTSFRCFERLS